MANRPPPLHRAEGKVRHVRPKPLFHEWRVFQRAIAIQSVRREWPATTRQASAPAKMASREWLATGARPDTSRVDPRLRLASVSTSFAETCKLGRCDASLKMASALSKVDTVCNEVVYLQRSLESQPFKRRRVKMPRMGGRRRVSN